VPLADVVPPGFDLAPSHSRRNVYVVAGVVGVVVIAMVVALISSSSSKGTFTLTQPNGVTFAARCNADARTVLTAVQAYDAQNAPRIIGVETHIVPGRPATYGLGIQAIQLVSAGYLASWPPLNGLYSISLSRTQPGAVMVYVPYDSAAGVNWEYQTGTNGCNALLTR